MPDSVLQKDAVIIGAGISGLATAYRLVKSGLDVLVLEKNSRVGGAIHTEKVDGFLIDYGPNSTLETSPKIRAFIEEIGLEGERVAANAHANRRYVLKHGRLLPLPMNPAQFLASKLFSGKAKLRLFKEPFIPPAPLDKEESIAEFVERRLGREFLDYAINPFVAGVYAGDPKRLSVRSAVAKIYALEKNYGSLIKGAIQGARERKKRAETAKTKAELFSFYRGMGRLSDAIAAKLNGQIRTGALPERVEGVNQSEHGYTVHFKLRGKALTALAKCVVFSTPADALAAYVKRFAPEFSTKLDEIVYAPVAVVFFGFRQSPRCRPLDGFGFLVPEVENRKILGTIWSSTIFPDRAPANGAALTTFVGGMRQPQYVDLDDERLRDLVLQELKEIMALETTPDLVKIKRWRRAIPQYQLGHADLIQAMERFESEHPGFLISGNFRNGISVGDCIVQSEMIADRARRFCEPAGIASTVLENIDV